MLTGDLICARVVKKQIHPRLVDPSNGELYARAIALCEAFAQAHEAGWTREELVNTRKEIQGDDVDHKLTAGMFKLLMDGCEFETRSPLDPIELRDRVFRRAAATGPLARTPGPTGRRVAADVIAEVAAELGCAAEEVGRALYADRQEEQVIGTRKAMDAQALLHRYNLALVQALLLRATGMVVRVPEPDPKRLRQLFRQLKFWQLMYRVRRDHDGAVLIDVDGPESLLRQSTRYGLQLANFFPTVVLEPGAWTVSAQVMWGRKRKVAKTLTIDSTAGLVSHYTDRGVWRSNTEKWFAERWDKLDSGWELVPGQLIDMGRQEVLAPDLTFRKGRRHAHLDIVGFWRKNYLETRLARTPPSVILAVSKRLAGDKAALSKTLAERVVVFAEIINAKAVLQIVERVAVRR